MQQDHPEQTEWFVSWFQHPLYLKLYQHRDRSEAKTTIETLLKLTGIKPGSEVLDVACGAGRHAVELAKSGMEVWANDLSEFLIMEAKALSSKSGTNIQFSQMDMRHLVLQKTFDLVVQLFTSFGYFKTRAEDETVLEHVHSALKPKGWYVLDFFNAHHVQENLVPCTKKTFEDLTITETRCIDQECVKKTITIKGGMETLSFSESVRLYSPEQLREMLEKKGFHIETELGSYSGESFDPANSKRYISLARKA